MQEPNPAKLVVISGILTGQVFPLESTTTTFGRDASNTIGVPDTTLSRLHCVFDFDREGWNVRDVGSSNGTFVNGQKIERQLLAEGDRISAGGCVLLFAGDVGALGSMVTFDEDAALVPTTRLVLSDMASIAPLDALRPVHPREQHLQGAAGDQHRHPCDSRRERARPRAPGSTVHSAASGRRRGSAL